LCSCGFLIAEAGNVGEKDSNDGLALLMSSIKPAGVRVCQQLILAAVAGLLFTGAAFGQGLRISDADVSLAAPVVLEDGSRQVSATSEKNSARVLKARPLIKLTSYKRTPDQILLEEAIYRESAGLEGLTKLILE